MSAHTPGPWVTIPELPLDFYQKIPDGFAYLGECVETVNKGEAEANAALIAAAPELYAVLKAMRPIFTRLIEQYEPDTIDAEWTMHALEALRLAEGRD